MAVLVASTVVAAVGPGASVSAATVPAGFVDELVATVSSPTAVEQLPDGRIVVAEQGGLVRAGQPGQPLAPWFSVPGTCLGSERGVLGLTADPAYLSNGRVFVYSTRLAPGAPGGCVNRVTSLVPGVTGETVLLDNISSINGNHNAGDLDVGSDGHLYVTTGDAGRDPRGDSGSGGSNDAARDLSILNGKVLRITLDGQPAPGNPLVAPGSQRCATTGVTSAIALCQEIAAWGLRNPYRFAFDPNRGDDRVFVNDVGQSTREEVDELRLGADYGWNTCEGPCSPARPGLTDPITSYPRSVGTYITAGAFVPDGLWPESLDGGYLFADGGSGKIFLRRADGSVDYQNPWATGAFGLADMVFAIDELGRTALYYTLNGSGQVRRIVWDPPAPAAVGDLAFTPVTPVRAYDTRTGVGVPAGDVRVGTTRLVDLDAPVGARAALVNVTVTQNAGWGFVQAWPPRTRRPSTSVVNVVTPREDVANTAVVQLDAAGRFVLQSTTATDLIVDVLGWFTETGGPTAAGRLVPVDPFRLVDTRQPAGQPLDSGSTNPYSGPRERRSIPVAGQVGLPAASAISGVAVIVTALAPSLPQSGFATVHPGGTAAPIASNVNTSGGGDIRANLAIVPLGGDGSLTITSERVEHLIVDVVGYVTSPTAPPSTSGLFTPLASVRVYDERNPGSPAAPAGGVLTLPLGGVAPFPVGAVLQNLTMTGTTGFDFVTASPSGAAPRQVSNVNAVAPGQTRAALAVTRLGSGGAVDYRTFGESQLIVDVFGVFRG